MTILKWLGSALIGLLLMLALAVFLVPMFVDPNDYRDDISELVKQQTGRDLTLAGDLKISVFPWLGIKTQGLRLSQPSVIGGDMVAVEEAQLRLKLLPLFSKQLEIDTIVLNQPRLNLITLQDGTSSFSGLAGDEPAQAPSTANQASSGSTTSETPNSPEASEAAVALVVQGVEISDANMVWDDRQAGQRYEIKDFNLSTGNLLGAEAAPIKLTGSVIDAANPVPIILTASGLAKIDKDSLVADLQDFAIEISQAEQSLELGLEEAKMDQGQKVAAQGIAFGVAGVLPASEDSSEAGQKFTLNGSLSALDFDFTGPLIMQGLATQGEIAARPFELSIPSSNIDLEKQTAAIPNLQLNSGDLQIAISDLKANQIIDQPSALGSLNIPAFNAQKLLSDLDIDYQPTGDYALKSVALNTQFAGGLTAASLKNLSLRLDNSTLTGNVSINDFENLATQFDLVLDQLNLDDYLPVADEAGEEPQVEGAEALAVPLAALRMVNANGSFKANSLISGGIKLEDIDVRVNSENGSLSVVPNAKLYDGTLGGNIAFQDNGDQATLKVKNEIDLVSLGNMLTDADITSQLTGLGSLIIDLAVTETQGVQSNEGVIKLVAKNGAIKGVDIKKILDGAVQTYQQFSGSDNTEPAAEGEQQQTQESDETRFAELLGTFYLKDNRLTNDDFSLKAPLFRILGSGDIDLAAQTLNYLVKVAVVGSTSGQGGQALDELAGITIPIRLRGDLTSPSYSLDMKSLYQSYAKRELDRKKGELLEKELGIENGENLSTKDILKGALLRSLTKDKDKSEETSEPVPYEESDEPVPYQDTESNEAPREQTKKERREERKRKLLESIFN